MVPDEVWSGAGGATGSVVGTVVAGVSSVGLTLAWEVSELAVVVIDDLGASPLPLDVTAIMETLSTVIPAVTASLYFPLISSVYSNWPLLSIDNQHVY